MSEEVEVLAEIVDAFARLPEEARGRTHTYLMSRFPAPNGPAELVARLIEADPHQWSTRPCSTCQTISSVLDRPFGCNARAK